MIALGMSLIGLLLLVTWLATSIVITPGKTAQTIEVLGNPKKLAYMPGLSFKLPVPFAWVSGTVSLQVREVRSSVDVRTADRVYVALPVSIQFRVSDGKEAPVKAHYELENPEEQITSWVLNTVKQTAAGMEFDDLYGNRDAIERDVRDNLSVRFNEYGFTIVAVLVEEPTPDASIRDAYNSVVASVREKEAATNQAEAKRILMVGTAKAEAESRALQGQGLAEMRKNAAVGVGEAMQSLSNGGLSVDMANQLMLELVRADTATSVASHGNMVLMDTTTGSLSDNLVATLLQKSAKNDETLPSSATDAGSSHDATDLDGGRE